MRLWFLSGLGGHSPPTPPSLHILEYLGRKLYWSGELKACWVLTKDETICISIIMKSYQTVLFFRGADIRTFLKMLNLFLSNIC